MIVIENNNVELIKKENITDYNNEDIRNLIYCIRGKQIMLDSDAAMLFKYETKDLNRNVKNNIERFPADYCFQLNDDEYKSLRCKNFTLNKIHSNFCKYISK